MHVTKGWFYCDNFCIFNSFLEIYGIIQSSNRRTPRPRVRARIPGLTPQIYIANVGWGGGGFKPRIPGLTQGLGVLRFVGSAYIMPWRVFTECDPHVAVLRSRIIFMRLRLLPYFKTGQNFWGAKISRFNFMVETCFIYSSSIVVTGKREKLF
jgi:hypothetical protein